MSDDASTEYKVIPIEQPRGFTSLTFAASVGDEAHVAALLEADPKALTTKDELMCDPLCWAARNSRVGVVSYLLGKDADVQSKSFGGMRPLHHACHVYDEAVIKELLSKNADANAPDDAGNTPFHYAVRRGVLNLCQMLVDAKADVTAKNAAGMTPLHTACNSGQVRGGAQRGLLSNLAGTI
jgi:ankyrin repeat protein